MADKPETSAKMGNSLLNTWLSWRRKRFWALVALLSYTLLGFFAAPALIRWIAESSIEQTGRTVSIEEIRVNPFLLTITMNGVELRDTDDTVILAYDEYFWDFQASSLFRWAWTFKEIRLVGLYLHEERFADTDTRFMRLAEALSASDETTEKATDEAGTLPRLIIGTLALQQGRVSIVDQVAGGFEGEMGPIDVTINDLRTLPDHSGAQTVSIRTAGDGLIEWRGTIETVPFASEGHLTVSGAGLADAFRYADHFLPFHVAADSVSVAMDYHAGLRDAAPFLSVENLQVEAAGGRIRADGTDEDTLYTQAIVLAGGSMKWPEQTARLESVRVDGAVLNAGLEPDGSLDLLALIPEFPEDDAGADAAPSAPWTLEIGAVDIDKATVNLEDATLSPPVALSLQALNLALRDIDNRDGTQIPVELGLQLSSGGQVAYSGQAQALPDVRTQGQLTLEGIALAVAQPYLAPFVRVDIENGLLGMSADFEHNPEQLAALAGRLGVEQLLIHDTLQDERLLSWDALRIDRFEADLAANRLVTSELEFDGLFGRLHIAEDLSTNVSDLLVESTGEQPAEAATELPELQIGGVTLNGAAMDFSDFSLPLPFRTNIKNLNGTVSTLSTTSSEPATVAMEGQVNEYGQARIDGNLNPWAPTDLANIDMVFRNLDLSRLTPYTVQFAGYAIDDGRMDLDLGYRLDQRKLNGDNKVIIRDIVLGDKVEHPDAGSLPLGLAIALLTDANGVIDLELPVEGDLDNPEFGIGSVVWQALGNLITKAVTAPFRLLGALVGIDSEDFGTLYFAAGRSDISPPDREQLVELAEAMQQRPELTVEIGGVYDPVADTAALKTQAVDDLFEQRAMDMPIGKDELSTDHERRVLEAIAAEQLAGFDPAALEAEHTVQPEGSDEAAFDLPAYVAALRAQLVAAQPVSNDDLLALASARAESALAALREGAPETELNARLAEANEVEGENAREIPLELSVSAGD